MLINTSEVFFANFCLLLLSILINSFYFSSKRLKTFSTPNPANHKKLTRVFFPLKVPLKAGDENGR